MTLHRWKTSPNGHHVTCDRCGKTLREYVGEGRNPPPCTAQREAA